jgi:hypothetical protein
VFPVSSAYRSQVATLENWATIMYQAMNSTKLDEQPILNGNDGMAVYFIVFLIVGVFFVLNLVVGVAIDQVRNHWDFIPFLRSQSMPLFRSNETGFQECIHVI